MIGGYFTDKITRIRNNVDKYGRTTSDSVTVFDCRLERQDQQIRTADGEYIQIRYKIMAQYDADLAIGDTIVFGESTTGENLNRYKVQYIDLAKGWTASHLEVYI